MDKGKWRTNSQGMIISPEAQKSERLHVARRAKKLKTNKDRYAHRELVRKCPKCGAVITKKRTLHRNDDLGIYRDETTVFICESCYAVWRSSQTIKIWERLKSNSKPMNCKTLYNYVLNGQPTEQINKGGNAG